MTTSTTHTPDSVQALTQSEIEEVLDILVNAKELILDEDRWTTDVQFEMKDGTRFINWAEAGTPNADTFDNVAKMCGVGAINMQVMLAGYDRSSFGKTLVRQAITDLFLFAVPGQHGYSHIVEANNKGGHSVIMQCFDDSIAILRSVATSR